MTPVIVGAAIVAASLAAAAYLAWLWCAGQGRHRAPRHYRGPFLLLPPGPPPAPPTGTYGTGVLVLDAQLPTVRPFGVEDPSTVALLLEADRAGLEHCPAEGRTRPHFIHTDGSRTCCECKTTTAGDQ
ncbi:hypothetical protein [Streptomyces fuscigenes]|uniref:hypothetical protein n=1 Tax=Streptomyces fuscigenes TaxID=1528880 RepID=UPI001F2E2998|nr:hypothetical protein [Streptomyces fuscigenes]MCF3960334.1 hypothetical protein [Streptomyces fuscigenes]